VTDVWYVNFKNVCVLERGRENFKTKKNQTQKKKKRSKKLKMGELPLLYLHEKGLYEIE